MYIQTQLHTQTKKTHTQCFLWSCCYSTSRVSGATVRTMASKSTQALKVDSTANHQLNFARFDVSEPSNGEISGGGGIFRLVKKKVIITIKPHPHTFFFKLTKQKLRSEAVATPPLA